MLRCILIPVQVWLKLPCHFFLRPNLSTVVMLDLDGFKGGLSSLHRLQPRALVQTSKDSYQLWLCIDQRHSATEALTVTKRLTQALQGDPCSARITQVGRLPGSINRKPGKMCIAQLLHCSFQNMCEQEYLRRTTAPVIVMEQGECRVNEREHQNRIDVSREDCPSAIVITSFPDMHNHKHGEKADMATLHCPTP